MSSTEAGGRQSPPPEDQSHAQVGQPAGGQGTDGADNKGNTNKSDLDVRSMSKYFPFNDPPMLTEPPQALSSNPKAALDDAVKDKFSKTQEPSINK